MKALTIRSVDEELAEALEREKARRGDSLNRTVLSLLRQALGIGAVGRRSNGLRELSGAWGQDELTEFQRNTAIFEQVDEARCERVLTFDAHFREIRQVGSVVLTP